MKISLLSLMLACSVVLFSCSNASDPESTATKMSINELSTSPGYDWFPAAVADYQPDSAIISQVKQAYDSSQHRFYMFVNPSCTCQGTRTVFPETIRVLKEAGIPEDHIEIYSMRGAKDKQPYGDRFTLHELPTIIVTRQNTTELSFSAPESGKKVEAMMLEAIQKP